MPSADEGTFLGNRIVALDRFATNSDSPTSASDLFRCGHAVPPERLEIGYAHCSRPGCVASWRRHRTEQEHLALVLVPKQGFAWVHKSDVASNTKSSGRG